MKFVAARWALALLACPAVAQAPRDDTPLKAYREELVALRWGGIGYCGIHDQTSVLKTANKRLQRVRDALVVRYGEPLIASEDQSAEAEFEVAFGEFDPVPCRRLSDDEKREVRWSLARDHDRSLDILEHGLGLVK